MLPFSYYPSPAPTADVSGTPFAHDDDRNALARWLFPAPTPRATYDNALWRQRLGAPDISDEHWATADGSPWQRSTAQNALMRAAESLNTPTGFVLSNFLGPAARTADRAALAKAQAAAAKGVPREQIWSDFGWFQGKDGKWRFEIDDRAARATPGPLQARAERNAVERGRPDIAERVPEIGYGGAARDGFDHPALYAAYPEIADTQIAYLPPTAPRWNASGRTPWGRSDALGVAIRKDLPDTKQRSVGLHEFQHRVQNIEGFVPGGSPRAVTPEQIAAERARLTPLDPDPTGWTSVGGMAGDISDAAIASEIYRRLAGEVEARAVQTRMDYTPAQRRARPPWLDYDVPENMQIVPEARPTVQASEPIPRPVMAIASRFRAPHQALLPTY